MGKNTLKLPDVGEFNRSISAKLIAVETITPPPPPPYKQYVFEAIEASVELWFKNDKVDHKLEDIESLNDFYGLGSSVKDAIQDAKTVVANKGLEPESEVYVIVKKVVRQFRAKSLDKESFYCPGYAEFQQLGWRDQQGLPKPVETIVWNSKTQLGLGNKAVGR